MGQPGHLGNNDGGLRGGLVVDIQPVVGDCVAHLAPTQHPLVLVAKRQSCVRVGLKNTRVYVC